MFKGNKMKVLISILPFGWGGAGDHIKEICDEIKPDVILVPKKVCNTKWINKLFVVIQFFFLSIFVRIFVKIYNCELILNHPQTLGYNLSRYLIENCNKIDYHVVDTHFFCIKSYNIHSGTACLRCLEGKDKYLDCYHFPRKQNSASYNLFQKTIFENLEKISFYCQTNTYKKLLHNKFGSNASVVVKKMHTFELKKIALALKLDQPALKTDTDEKKYDIGYHAAFIPAKGSKYICELMSYNHNKNYFIPAKYVDGFPNADFVPCSWHDGMQSKLKECKIIICPSIWSAPVEGAVLKSMLFGQPVALMPSNTFVDELPSDSFIKLTGKIGDDSKIFDNLLKDENSKKLQMIGLSGRKFAIKYLEDHNKIESSLQTSYLKG